MPESEVTAACSVPQRRNDIVPICFSEPSGRFADLGGLSLAALRLQVLGLLLPGEVVQFLEGYGLRVVERLPIEIPATDANREYLRTKRDKLGHILSVISPRDRAS